MDKKTKAPELETEVALEAAPLQVAWQEGDNQPTVNLIKTVRVRAFESGRLLKVMKTADSSTGDLEIYVDVL